MTCERKRELERVRLTATSSGIVDDNVQPPTAVVAIHTAFAVVRPRVQPAYVAVATVLSIAARTDAPRCVVPNSALLPRVAPHAFARG